LKYLGPSPQTGENQKELLEIAQIRGDNQNRLVEFFENRTNQRLEGVGGGRREP